MSSLWPWDLSMWGLNFSFYRPRRPSYTHAITFHRGRSESYRYATRRCNSDSTAANEEDYIERAVRILRRDQNSSPRTNITHNRSLPSETSGIKTTESEVYANHVNVRLHQENVLNNISLSVSENSYQTECVSNNKNDASESNGLFESRRKLLKNLILLCISLIFIFSAFRAIQNLQSSLNATNNLGITSLSCLYISSVISGFLTPTIINKLHSKLSLSLGTFCFIPWITANIYPSFLSLVPTALLAGIGQSILWSAENTYLAKLALDTTRRLKQQEYKLLRLQGVFVACFQTHHMWGNLISSLVLSMSHPLPSTQTNGSDIVIITTQCGVLYPCGNIETIAFSPNNIIQGFQKYLWRLIVPYIAMAALSFLLVLFFLDRIGAKVDPGRSSKELIVHQTRFFGSHSTFPFLIPLVLFTGLQEGFIFGDFNQAFVTCSLGIQYIGYCMITLGVSNVLGALLIAICASFVPREAVLAVGAVIHVAIMIGYLLWIPDNNLALFLGLAAAWGICDAIWHTQCNSLICITCVEDPFMAFTNYRIVQSCGLFVAFVSSTFLCVSTKLYFLIIGLVTAVLFYVIAEYRIRHDDNVFCEEAEVAQTTAETLE